MQQPLQGCNSTRTPLARVPACPPAPQSGARRGPAQFTPRRGGRCFLPAPRTPGVGVGIGSEPAGLQEEESGAGRGRRRRREQEAAVTAARPGPATPSRATCMGHPQGGRQTAAKRCTPLLRSCPGAQARRTPPPIRARAPQLLEPKFAQAPASSASPSSRQPAGLVDSARPGCESRRPSLGPGAAWV